MAFPRLNNLSLTLLKVSDYFYRFMSIPGLSYLQKWWGDLSTGEKCLVFVTVLFIGAIAIYSFSRPGAGPGGVGKWRGYRFKNVQKGKI